MIWAAVIVAGIGCYLLKLAGLSVPPWVLERPLVERVADLIPVALLSALIAVQVFSHGHDLVIDARAVGLGVAVVLLLLRAPFLVVVFGAALVAALLRPASERRQQEATVRTRRQARSRKCSSPTSGRGAPAIARSPVRTPGVNEARSSES